MADDGKIIAFPGAAIPSNEPDARIVEMLGDIHAMAVRGEIVSFAIAAETSDSGMLTGWRRGDAGSVHILLGGISVVQQSVLNDGLEHR